MKVKRSLILGTVLSLVFMGAGLLFAQEQAAQGQETQENPGEPGTQWIWGEVVSVDASAKQIVVKFLDYETYNEEDITLTVDEKTTYENVKGLEEIKAKDTVSIDYVVNPSGKNLARNISLEKPENETPETPPAPEGTAIENQTTEAAGNTTNSTKE